MAKYRRLEDMMFDMDLALAIYRQKKACDRETIKIAYSYRLEQLHKYGTKEQYEKYVKSYERVMGEKV